MGNLYDDLCLAFISGTEVLDDYFKVSDRCFCTAIDTTSLVMANRATSEMLYCASHYFSSSIFTRLYWRYRLWRAHKRAEKVLSVAEELQSLKAECC